MKKRFFEVTGGFFLFLLSVVFFTEIAQAQFKITALYAVTEGTNLIHEYYDLPNSSSRNDFPGGTGSVTGTSKRTLAIGPWYNGGAHGVGTFVLVAYVWNSTNTGVDVRRVTPKPAGGAPDVSNVIKVPNNSAPGALYRAWSGGEVNQLTGEIYLSAEYTQKIEANFRLGVYDPYSGAFKNSGKLDPKTAAEDVKGTVYSDMAIDSDGNAYIMVQPANAKAQPTLIRVEIGGDNARWKYSKVKTFNSSLFENGDSSWGMAFLNGKLYVATNTNNRLLELNPLTGDVRQIGNSTKYHDLAAAQTAPIVKGIVYNDLNGDGVITQNEKDIVASGAISMADNTIELYDSNKKYLGSTTTNSLGEYFLMLDATDVDYYIRLKRPRINGIKSVQTWASAGRVDGTVAHSPANYYTVTAYTHDTDGNVIEVTTDSVCSGRLSAFDHNDPNTNTNLDETMIYSKIHLGYNITGKVDFGITAMSDLGNAPFESSFTTAPTTAPAHLTLGEQLYLGNAVTTDNLNGTMVPSPTENLTNDGVWVVMGEKNIALSDTVLEAGNTYTIKVKTSGPERTKGYLNAFISCSSAGAILSTFQNGVQIATNSQSSTTNDTITFTYTVPMGIPEGKSPSYMRFRFSNAPSLQATGNRDPSAAENWYAIYGEVEDYPVYLRRRTVPQTNIPWPGGASLTYGQSLDQATFLDHASGTHTGNFSFKNPDMYLTVADHHGTTMKHIVIFDHHNFDNYESTEKELDLQITVFQKGIDVSSLVVADKFYDGTTKAWIKNLTFSGLVLNDTLHIGTDYTTEGAFLSPDPGTNQEVSITTANLHPASIKATNYSLAAASPLLRGTAAILSQPADNGVVIGTSDALNLSYAILDLESTTKGLRLPRLTSEKRDNLDLAADPATANSAKGLLIFNEDDKNLQYWNGSEWKAIDGTPLVSTGGTPWTNKGPSDVVIGNADNNTDYFALLKIESDSRGIRLPWVRSTIADALVQPVGGGKQGLLLYNVDTNFIEYWNGNNWTTLDGTVITGSSPTGSQPTGKEGVNIGDANEPPFHSELAFAEAEATAEKAIQLPRLATIARNSLTAGASATELQAAAGLIIFNTDSKILEFFDGVDWKQAQ